jgi:predicted transcriptional regulator YdeE
MEKPYRASESGFYVVGLETRTSKTLEDNPQTARIPALWERSRRENLEEQIPRRLAKGHPFCVYFDYENGHTGAYSVVVGYQVPGLEDVPPGLTGLSIPGGKYLVFTAEPQDVAQTWAAVWDYFAQPSAPRRAFTYDYEEYFPRPQGGVEYRGSGTASRGEGRDEVRIYVAVR